MSILARYPQKQFAPCPEGLHQAVCVDIVDLGLVATDYGSKYQVRLVWQIADIDAATGRRFDVAKFYTNSLHPRAKLRHDLDQWRGQPFTEVEAQRFDLETLLGVNALIKVTHYTSNHTGDVHAQVAELQPCPKTTAKLAPIYVRHQERTTRAAAPVSVTRPTTPRPAAPPLPDLDTAMPESTPFDTPAPDTAPLPSDEDDISFAFGANTGEVQ